MAHSQAAGAVLYLARLGLLMGSMLAGASVVHAIYKPDLTIPLDRKVAEARVDR